jgi:hypothetical protein
VAEAIEALNLYCQPFDRCNRKGGRRLEGLENADEIAKHLG